jgi:membrane fusion protein (multidrug efflux system)
MRTSVRIVVWVLAAMGAVAAVVLLLMVLAGVFEDKVGPAEERPGGPLAAAAGAGEGTVVEVIAREVPVYEWAVGTVRAVHETTLGSRLLATVARVHVEAGLDVEAGQVLVELDDRDLQARLARASAEIEVAAATRDQARSDYERISRLAAEDGASPFELTTATNALRAAEAEHLRAQQSHREAEAVLSFTTIRAPVAGRVVDKLVDAGDMVAPGQPLLTMYDPTRMQLVATVRESLRRELAVGDPVGVKLDVLDHVCEATVSEIVPETQVASRSFEVKVTGPCPPGVYPGMFGRLRIPLGTRSAICVPAAAVRQVGQLDLVEVIEGDVVRCRLVQPGRQIDEEVEVLSGLASGERVVVPPPGVLETGGES